MACLALLLAFVVFTCQSFLPPTSQQYVATTKCMYYDPRTCPPATCNKTVEVCGEPSVGKRWHCYALWKNKTGTVEMLMSGCWIDVEKCYDQLACVSNDMSRTDESFCCCDGDLCNAKVYNSPARISPVMASPDDDAHGSRVAEPRDDQWIVQRTVLLSLLPLIVFASVVILLFWLWRRRKLSRLRQQAPHEAPSPALLATPYRPLGPIQLLEVKASGRFGCVWKAQMCDGSTVAVKIFPPCDQQSWLTERGFYSLPQVAGQGGILHFIGAEMNGSDYWLVTDYHDRGSLYDYLKTDVVTVDELLRIALSMCHGLAFLHTPLGAKSAVAHRDFKSRNVLVRSDLTACVADFGLALILDQHPGDVHGQVGTRRYMSPEVLDGSINFSIEHFLKIDVYACALVLWELMSRCVTGEGLPGDYHMPFEEEVGLYPTLEEMQEVVVTGRKRPQFKPHWLKNEELSVLCSTIDDCWDHDPEARLSTECVEARLSQLYHSPSVSDVSVASVPGSSDAKEKVSLVV